MEHHLTTYITHDTLISALGFGTQENLEAIRSYHSGITLQTDKRIADTPLLAATLSQERLQQQAEAIGVSGYPRMEQLFILTINELIRQSGQTLEDKTCGLILSTTKGNIDLLARHTEHPDEAVFLWKMAENIAGYFHAEERVHVISNACISGVSALIAGKRMIENGIYRRVIVAGGDLLSHFITSGFGSFRSLSSRPCRPYDSSRDGLNLGEACGAVLLSSEGTEEHVILSGGAVSNDANHISGPSRTGDGLYFAIRQAMQEAGTAPQDISFVNAHGTATLYNDEMESKAIHLAGLAAVPVNSLKPYFGHTLGASGIIETILCIEQLKEGRYYGTLGYETLGVPMPITVYATHQPIPMKCCIKTASGFGGCNAALVLSLPDAHLKQKANSQATDKASTPSVCKAVVESGNMVTIRPGAVESKGTTVFSSSETDFALFIREAYKHLGENNMKFYKMDNLCKLGYVAAEYLLKDTHYRPEEIGIILANASSSLDTDCKHQAIISKEGDKAASPAVFVYTLPNVVLGEICIRHKIQGENTFFVRRQSDAASLEDYARIVMAKGKLRTCIIGWCELLDGHYQAEFKQLNNISTIYG